MCLAICDALQPNVIWEDLKFDKLQGSNLLDEDFFSVLSDLRQGKPTVLKEGFDVIIGNPPFESELSSAGKDVDKAEQRQNKERGVLPDHNSAYLFLEQAFGIMRLTGRVCLIQPHGLLYNRKAQHFRTYLFQKYKTDAIFDFVSIRKLYEGADAKTIAVLAQAGKPSDDHQITHQTFRRTVSVKEHICFELDHYDWHHVSQKQAERYPYVWRSNLLGGGRLFDISQRFQSMRNLARYVKQERWDYGEGFIIGTGEKSAPFLTGKNFLPTRAFTNVGINESEIRPLTETRFESPRNEKRFTPPLILIKKMATLPIRYWDKGVLTYEHRIVGIHAPQTQASELRNLFESLINKRELYQFCCELYGTESLVNKVSAIRKQDIDALPYPENMNDLSFSFWEKALCEDTLNYMTDYIRLGQNSAVLTKAAEPEDLNNYSNMFVRMLKSVYDNLNAAPPVFLNGLICQPFYFGEPPNFSWLAEDSEGLRRLIYDDEKHASLRTVRVLRFYDENYLFLVKSDRLRYWIRSTAIRDADETMVDLRRWGY